MPPTFIFRRLHSEHPPRDFVCVLRVWDGMISTIGRVSPSLPVWSLKIRKATMMREYVRPTMHWLAYPVSRIPYSASRIPHRVLASDRHSIGGSLVATPVADLHSVVSLLRHSQADMHSQPRVWRPSTSLQMQLKVGYQLWRLGNRKHSDLFYFG